MIMDLLSDLPVIVANFLDLSYYTIYAGGGSFVKTRRRANYLSCFTFIGHLHLLCTQQTGARTLAALADKYGPFFTIRVGRFRTVVVSSPEAVKVVSSLMIRSSPIRKLAVVELLSVHRVALLKHVQVLEVNAFIKYLYLFCKKIGQKISIGPRLEVLIVNMMVRMIAGKRYVSRADGEANEEAQRVIKFIKEFASVLATVTAVSEWFQTHKFGRTLKSLSQRGFSQAIKMWIVWDNFEMVPFGSGKRACPGMSWALQAICLTMARMLQGFDLTTPSNAPVDMNEDQGASATMLKATPLELILTPRLPRHLHQL
ncbi:cytochrome P450 CYP82D47-like [Gossypium australe]|uniref:Cytochrome P450 CYP82D47-like n=1 Tax=Gossypium australe TaxID=47621 RepID=A0A5B6UND9_9ROSI|nr:cytochrome P450 CYP82D47-like [Gossypium australe]